MIHRPLEFEYPMNVFAECTMTHVTTYVNARSDVVRYHGFCRTLVFINACIDARDNASGAAHGTFA
jgi:hypothetical protein